MKNNKIVFILLIIMAVGLVVWLKQKTIEPNNYALENEGGEYNFAAGAGCCQRYNPRSCYIWSVSTGCNYGDEEVVPGICDFKTGSCSTGFP